MGSSSLRRLRIYYMNNFRAMRNVLSLIVVVCFLLFMIGSRLFGFRPTAFYQGGEVSYRDSMSILRALNAMPDTRPQRCRDHAYEFTRLEPGQDATVSLISHFHGAAEFDDLKLALTAVVQHTPYDLYREIVVIDDGTVNEDVERISGAFLRDSRFNKVKIYRSDSHDGPSSSRFKAAAVASGNMLVFIDPAAVVNHGWLQPLIAKLLDEPSLIAVPHYDELGAGDRLVRVDDDRPSIFTWTLSTVYTAAAPDQDTIKTPVMRGDVFAVRKQFLDNIGNFDEHLKQVRGSGYHVELSLRAWMCGGAVRIVTCSRVAVRGVQRPQRVDDDQDFRHIAELAFDKPRRSLLYRQTQVDTSMTESESDSLMIRQAYLRRQLSEQHCRPLDWYFANVVPSTVVQPSDDMERFGKLRTSLSGLCLGGESHLLGDVELVACHDHLYERELLVELTNRGALVRDGSCLESVETAVAFVACEESSPRQRWWLVDGRLTPVTAPRKCLTDLERETPGGGAMVHVARLEDCAAGESNSAALNQRWQFLNS